MTADGLPALSDDEARLPGGPRLAVRRAGGPGRPFLLVHGLASNARLWDGVARRLAAAGHEAVAVDQRGHGRSDRPADGYDTQTCAADLAALCGLLGFTGERRPVVAGQSWGGNVVLTLAAGHCAEAPVAALALVDGGWLRPRDRFDTFEQCWAALAPPSFEGVTAAALAERFAQWHPDWPAESVAGALANFEELPGGGVRARLRRDHHRSILHSLWAADPAALYPLVDVPVLLAPAVGDPPRPGDAEREASVAEALAALPRAEAAWYRGADHDLHAQHPDRLAQDLLRLAALAGEEEAE